MIDDRYVVALLSLLLAYYPFRGGAPALPPRGPKGGGAPPDGHKEVVRLLRVCSAELTRQQPVVQQPPCNIHRGEAKRWLNQSDTASAGVFSRGTNKTQKARVYSRNGPIRGRTRGVDAVIHRGEVVVVEPGVEARRQLVDVDAGGGGGGGGGGGSGGDVSGALPLLVGGQGRPARRVPPQGAVHSKVILLSPNPSTSLCTTKTILRVS
eukprot:1192879-Prorocentrum_minimum.AAC.1